MALAVPLLLPSASSRGTIVQVARAHPVEAWGNNDEGQTTVSVAAQRWITAIAAGAFQTEALFGGVRVLP